MPTLYAKYDIIIPKLYARVEFATLNDIKIGFITFLLYKTTNNVYNSNTNPYLNCILELSHVQVYLFNVYSRKKRLIKYT